MSIIDTLLYDCQAQLARATVKEAFAGPYWAAVVLDDPLGAATCGLCTIPADHLHNHSGSPPAAASTGDLPLESARDLAELWRSDDPVRAAIGLATVNAALPVDAARLTEINAAEVLAVRGAGKRVAIVGHFPFVGRLRKVAGHIDVLELHPGEGDLPASVADEVLPRADVVGVTGSSLVNHSFDDLMALIREDAYVVVLGGSTPLSPRLLDLGVDVVAGCVVVDIPTVVDAVREGVSFREMQGKRLVTLERDAKV